jgi:hypothetical protein
MLTLKDCKDFADLTEEETRVIAEQQGVHEIVATAMGSSLLESDEGVSHMKRLLLKSIDKAEAQGRKRKVNRLQRALARLDKSHPHSKPGRRHRS